MDTEKEKVKFICPNDGEISADDVAFLCNKCDVTEAKNVEGMYICPQCFSDLHPFQCRVCESKEVTMHADLGINTKRIHPDHDEDDPTGE